MKKETSISNSGIQLLNNIYENLPEDVRKKQGWILLATPAVYMVCEVAKEAIQNGYCVNFKMKNFEVVFSKASE